MMQRKYLNSATGTNRKRDMGREENGESVWQVKFCPFVAVDEEPVFACAVQREVST